MTKMVAIFLSGTGGSISMKLGTYHQGPRPIIVCLIHDLGLTLICFMESLYEVSGTQCQCYFTLTNMTVAIGHLSKKHKTSGERSLDHWYSATVPFLRFL